MSISISHYYYYNIDRPDKNLEKYSIAHHNQQQKKMTPVSMNQ